MSVAPFPREAEQARLLFEEASSLLVAASSEAHDVYDKLANLATIASYACSDPPSKKHVRKACWHLRGGRD